MKLSLSSKRRPKKSVIDIDALQSEVKKEEFKIALKNKFDCLRDEADVEMDWTIIKQCINDTAREVCGTKEKKRNKWLTDQVSEKIKIKQIESGSAREQQVPTSSTKELTKCALEPQERPKKTR